VKVAFVTPRYGPQVMGGAETAARQLAELKEMGCGYGQGFLVARPMAAPGVEALIRTGSGPELGISGAGVSDNETKRVII